MPTPAEHYDLAVKYLTAAEEARDHPETWEPGAEESALRHAQIHATLATCRPDIVNTVAPGKDWED